MYPELASVVLLGDKCIVKFDADYIYGPESLVICKLFLLFSNLKISSVKKEITHMNFCVMIFYDIQHGLF